MIKILAREYEMTHVSLSGIDHLLRHPQSINRNRLVSGLLP